MEKLNLTKRYIQSIAILSLMFASAATASAQEGRVVLKNLRVSAGEVMNLIEDQSHYRFAYNRNDFDTTRLHRFTQNNVRIKDALDKIVEGSGSGYLLRNRYIALVPANTGEPEKVAALEPDTSQPPSMSDRTGNRSDVRKDRTNGGIPDGGRITLQIVLSFRFDSPVVDAGFKDNRANLNRLHDILTDADQVSRVDSVIIKASSSPDGSPSYNRALAQRRTDAIMAYIAQRYPHIDLSIFRTYAQEGYWDRLLEIVANDPNVPGRIELMEMIDDPGLSDAVKSQKLNSIQGGRTFAYLRDNLILQSIRMAIIELDLAPVPPEPEPEPEPDPEPEPEPVPLPEPLPVPQPEPPVIPLTEPVVVFHAAPKNNINLHSYALRTNLLLAAAGAANLGIEIPVGENFSFAGEFAFARTRIANIRALQTTQGTLEARYWFKPGRNTLTRWNLGLYVTYGDRFDIQWGNGLQGDGYISGGLSFGYSFALSDRLNLDLSALGGLVYSPELRSYERPQEGHLMWNKTTYNARRLSLTMLRFNLVWLINKKN